jgi:hypothetical protein
MIHTAGQVLVAIEKITIPWHVVRILKLLDMSLSSKPEYTVEQSKKISSSAV